MSDQAYQPQTDAGNLAESPALSDDLLGGLLDLTRQPHLTAAEAELVHQAADSLLRERRQREQLGDMVVAEERSRLARELHDTVAQSLAALVHKLDQIGEPRAEIVEARALAHQALEDMRRAIWGLRPALLETLPFHEALAREVEQMADAADLSSRISLAGQPRPLLPQQEMALFRIAQEALSNTVRHAAARRVRVHLIYAEEEVQLLIEDDGRGFDRAALERAVVTSAPWPPYFELSGAPATGSLEGHFGVRMMRERARLIGGSLKLESAPGQGTRILITVPYAPASAIQASVGSQKGVRELAPAAVPAGRIRVLIVDDHAVTRAGIRRLLESYPDIEIVGEAADGLQALSEAQDLGPQVVLMDRRMAGMDGLEALRQLHASNRDVRVLMVSAFEQDEDVLESLKAGASGYVLKDLLPDELANAVRAAARGETLLSPALTGRLIDRFGRPAPTESQATPLTAREQDVLRALASGLRNKEIARHLHVSERTVTFHLANIYQKLGVASRTEALSRALELGLLKA